MDPTCQRLRNNWPFTVKTVGYLHLCSPCLVLPTLADIVTTCRAVRDDFDFCFAENGLTAIKLGQDLECQSFIKFMGEDNYKRLVKFVLHYIADMEIPIKRYVPS